MWGEDGSAALSFPLRLALHYLSAEGITLTADPSNPDHVRLGTSTIPRFRADDGAYVKVHDGQSGYLAQSSLPLYFGLAGAQQADLVEVKWPSGTVQKLTGPIALDETLTITEK